MPSLVKIGPEVFEKIFKISSVYFAISQLSPPYLNKIKFPPPKDALCQVWLKLALWFWRRRLKCEKLRTDGRQAIRKAHFQLR